MSFCEIYYLAKTAEDAYHALTTSQGLVRIIAGGTDLLLEIQRARTFGDEGMFDIGNCLHHE